MIKYDVLLYDATHDYDQLYTYHHGTPLNIGERVLVPFGPKNAPREAVVVCASTSTQKSKAVIERLNLPCISEHLIELIVDVHCYYLCPMGQLLRLALPKALRVKPQVSYRETGTESTLDPNTFSGSELDAWVMNGRLQRVYRYQPMIRLKKKRLLLCQGDPSELEGFRDRLPKSQRKVRALLSALLEHGEYALDKTIRPQHLELLLDSGLIALEERTASPSANLPHTLIHELPVLNAEQLDLANQLMHPEAHLLQGPPGSGKSMILMHLVKRTLKEQKRFIWMVSDTMQAMSAYQELYRYFGENIALIHAHMSKSEILYQYEQLINGQCVGIVGSRNVLFAPLQNVGLVVVDDCEDDRFVSEWPDFDLRKAACLYAGRLNIPVVMASSVPDLAQLADKTIRKHYLQTAYFDTKRDWHIVDLRNHLLEEETLLSPPVLEALHQKSLLYMNRLGYAGLVYCEHCHYVERCLQCQSALFFSQSKQRLHCRQCGTTQPFQENCPRCHHAMQLKGSGTETLEHRLKQHFPAKQVQRFDSISLQHKKDILQASHRMAQADLLIATSILSSSQALNHLQSVIHVAPDAGLLLPEYRSAEKTFRTLILMGAMVGRREEGHVYVQTEMPENYVYAYAKKEEILPFLKYEYKLRQHHALPPYMHLIRIELQHEQVQDCLDFAQHLKQVLCSRFSYTCRGPYRPMYEKKGKYYEQNLLFSDLSEMQDLKDYLRALVPRGAQRMRVIVDPLTIMY